MSSDHRTPTPFEAQAKSNMETLKSNPYPGRGIVMGFNEDGSQAIQVYWVMGRSENSRNRILVRAENIIRTEPFDPSKVKDPSLIIYTAMAQAKGIHVVSNGDQTDTVINGLKKGGNFTSSLKERTYEPDSPNFTPRITAAFAIDDHMMLFSEIRRDPGKGDTPLREMFQAPEKPGIGYCLHTYKGDGNPLPSFDQDPYPVLLNGTIDDIANKYWDLLNPENRVALTVKSVDVTSGQVDFRIINKLT